MAEDFARLKTERAQLRRLFTLAAKLVESSISAVPLDLDKVNENYAKLADKTDRLFSMDRRVGDAFFDDEKLRSNEDEIQKEFEVVEEYRDVWTSITSKRESLLEKLRHQDAPDHSSVGTSSDKLKLKLPKLDIRKFDIKPQTWISFWASFKKIDERDDLDPEDKFQLLLRMSTEGTAARRLLDSFPPSAANYAKALAQLKQRFGRDELLIELYVRELLGLVLTQAKGSAPELRQLFDNLEARLMALESLGVTSDRFACMLLPLVESSLPETVIREWEKARSASEDSLLDATKQMEQLRLFLRKEVASEERVALARSSFLPASAPRDSYQKPFQRKPVPEKKVATAAGLVSLDNDGAKVQCVFCAGDHLAEYCSKAREMDSESRIQVLKNKRLCFKCLRRFHVGRRCKYTPHCLVCSKPHATAMCSEPMRKSNEPEPAKSVQRSVEQNLSNTTPAPVLMQTLQVKVISSGAPVTARVLLDTGSQRSYITSALANKMGYEPLGEENIMHSLFGGESTGIKTHKRYKVRLRAIMSQYACNFEVLDTETICGTVPAIPREKWISELREKNIVVSDTSEGPVDILVGSDVVGKLFTGRKEILSCGLVAMETSLGWTLMGRIRDCQTDSMLNVLSMCTIDLTPSELWRLDVVGINEPADISTLEEARTVASEHFLSTVKISAEGRYEVSLPWLIGHPPLPHGFQHAASRLEGSVKKLRSEGLFDEYDAIFREWLKEEIIEEVSPDNWNRGHYLPHRAVVKENSTTRVRPVFDASAGKPNLNQCLEKGDNLIELIPAVLFRFRMRKIGVVSDIRRAFLQIVVNESDRDYLRFLWIDNSGRMRIFRHRRVVFGVTSSPYLLGAVINHHLSKCEKKASDGGAPYDVSTISQLRESFYVDNCVTSVNDQENLELFVRQAKSVFLEACFDLRGWEWSDPLLTEVTDTPVLGVIWDRKNDVLRVHPPNFENSAVITRRSVLSASQRLFDPLGFCAPTTLIPKLIIQESWKDGGTWDTPLSDKNKNAFANWMTEIHAVDEIEIPRWIKASIDGANMSLHTFCDSSKLAFAAVSYLRVDTTDGVSVILVAAKSRVAPLKMITIPRLELLAATIGSRLASSIVKELGPVKCYFWSDSTTVLSWIRREEPWGVFVYNRVKEIRSSTHSTDWNHVPGQLNPADLASRGCSPKVLLGSRWWEGPEWLRRPFPDWPSGEGIENEIEILEERRKTPILSVLDCPNPLNSTFFCRFSKFSKNVRVIAWIFRFLFNKYSNKPKMEGGLTLGEMRRAEKVLWKMVQEESFGGVKDVALRKLKPHVGVDGLIRLRTKIWARKDSEEFRSPIILPTQHEIVSALVMEMHKRNGHVIGQNLLSLLREQFWIVRGRQTIKKIVAQCAVCQRQYAKCLEVESPPLPETRVRDAGIFEICGVDLAGPLYLSDGSKVWIALYTCAVYRAVHLELVTSLSTEAFMLCLRRFVAIRGRPSIIYSDNGLNFRGTHNVLKEVDWSKIVDQGTIKCIEWRFNPPRAAWWGGFWERLVGIVKVILKKILGRSALSYEELTTVMYECATFVNRRPLTYVSESPEDPIAITPQMFLQEVPENGVPDLDAVDAASMKRKLRKRVMLREELRRRFRVEYLGQLNHLPGGFREKRSPKVGEVVLIGSECNKRADWPLAVVEECILSKDGKCRAVVVKTAKGRFSRAIQHIFPLEISSQEPETSSPFDEPTQEIEDIQADEKEDPSLDSSPIETELPTLKKKIPKIVQKSVEKDCETRCGRKVKLPIRYAL